MEVAALGLKVDGAEGIDRAADALDNLSDAGKRAEVSADHLADAFKALTGGQRQLLDALNRMDSRLVEIAVDMGRTATATEAASQALGRGGRAVDSYTTSLGHADRALQRFIDRQTGATRATQMWEGPLADIGREMDRLRAKYNPLFAVSKQYEAELDELNRAHRLGAISAQEHANALTMLNARFQQVAVATGTAAQATTVATANYHSLGNSMSGLAAQFQDIGVTAAMGMNPLIIGLQQGTQIAGQMEMAMSRGASAAGVFGAAFKSLLSPITAASIGLTVLASALIQAVDWGKVAKASLGALADVLETIAPYAATAAAGLALLYAPTILGGIVSLTGALVSAGRAALGMAAAFALANPATIFVAAFAGAITAAYVFRDAIQSAIGVDVIGVVKTAANYVINSFVAAYDDIKFVWNNFGNIMGNAVIVGVNIAIGAINRLIEAAFDGINGLVEGLRKIPGARSLLNFGELGEGFKLDALANPFEGLLGEAVAERNKKLAETMGRDSIGAFIKGATEAGKSAADWLRNLTFGDEKLSKATRQLREWLAEQAIAIASANAMTEAYLAGGDAIVELTRQQTIEEQVLKHGEKARKAITAAVNEHAKALDRLDVARQINDLRRQNAASTAYLAVLAAQSRGYEEGRIALEAYNEQQALNALLLGKSAEEVADLLPRWKEMWGERSGLERQIAAQEEINQLLEDNRTKQERYNVAVRRLETLRGFAATAEQIEAVDRAMRKLNQESSAWFDLTEKSLERIDQSFADMWRNVIDGSENAFDAMSGGFNQMLAEMAHAAITRPIMISVGNSIMGTSRPGGMGDVWGGGSNGFGMPGGGNLLSTAGSWLSGMSFTTGASVGSVGLANAVGSVGGDAIGALIAGNAGWSGGAGAMGALGAGLSAIGSAMPYIGMGVLAYGLLKDAFKGETRFGAGYMINPATGQAVRTGGPSGGDQQSAATMAAISDVWATTDRLAKLLGGSASGLQFGAGLETSPEKGRSFVWSDWGLTPDQVSYVEGMRDLSGVTDASVVAQEFAVELQRAVLRGLQLAGIDEAINAHLSKIDISSLDEAGVQAVMANLTALVQLRDAIAGMPFAPAVAGTFAFAEALAAAAGGADNAAALLGSFYTNYYSEAERAAWLTQRLTEQFAELGFTLPTSREEMRGLVEANMALGEAGAQTVAALLGLEGALSSILPAFDAVGESVSDVFGDQMNVVRSLASETNRLLGVRNRAGTVLDQIDRAMGRTGMFAATREAELWASLMSGSYEQQIELAGELSSIVTDRISAEIAASEQLRDAARSVREYVQSLFIGNLSPLTMGEQLGEAARQYGELLAKAQGGDVDAMRSLQGAADAYLNLARDYYASSDVYTDIFGYVTSSLDALGIQAESDAQRQLGISEDSLAELEGLRAVVERAYSALDRQYGQSLQALQTETALLTSIGADTGRLHDIAGLLGGLPAELAAILQPFLTGAASGTVGGWYQDAGFTDAAGQDYWTDQLQKRPGADVRQDYLESLVRGWYQDAYGTDPDAEGWQYWAQQAGQMGASEAYKHWQYAAGLHGSHRDGLWSVPFDGYRAELHRNEMVLTESQANHYRASASMPDWSQYGREDALVAEVRALREEVAKLRAERKEGDGLVANTVAASAQAGAREIVQGVTEATSRNDWQQGNQQRYGSGR